MSVQAVTAYRVGTLVFPTIQEAQAKELQDLLADGGAHTEVAKSVIDSIIEHADEVVAILTCQPKSKGPRKPRSDIGKKRAKNGETPSVL